MAGKSEIRRVITVILVVGLSTSVAAGSGFDDIANWAAFDAGEHGVGTDPDGYWGSVFDGRYVYFAPGHNGSRYHGEVLRYDTSGDFSGASSWAAYDPGANGVGTRPAGYTGAVFDGRYVYFAPLVNAFAQHGEVLRYDTTAAFAEAASWTAYDAGSHGVGGDADGYHGAVFDGRYVYFVPFNNGSRWHGLVLRYDTTLDFATVSSWATYEPRLQGVGSDGAGFLGGVFDGQYVYFVPAGDDSGFNGEVFRYDTSGDFKTVTSWSAFDAGDNGVGTDPDGFCRAVFDGRYIYFAPLYADAGDAGEFLRYDTLGGFSDVSSWTAYDPGENGVGDNPDGFVGGVFDGRYIYFSPHYDQTSDHEELLRFDTSGSFTDASSWAVFDPAGSGVGSGVDGRYEGVFDGRYVYFAPFTDLQPHGEVLRYDTRIGAPVPTVSEWGLVAMAILVLTAGTVVLRVLN